MTTPKDEIVLSAEAARGVGALVEKQVTTPEYYPLTLNALVNACNQINNRDPVVTYDEATVARALESLRDKRLAREVRTADGRVPKYRQVFEEVYALSRPVWRGSLTTRAGRFSVPSLSPSSVASTNEMSENG